MEVSLKPIEPDDQLSVEVHVENTPQNDSSIQEQNENRENDVDNEMIPEELLFALTQSVPVTTDEQLSPIKKLKTPEKLRMALKKGPPANVWHHKNRRMQFKHLTDNPRSLGKGVGTRDISFLYDVASEQKPRPPHPSQFDKSTTRLEAAQQQGDIKPKYTNSNIAVPDTIIPKEYHIVKTKAVLGLEYIDDSLTTKLTDHDQILRLFPSLIPSKRFEVIQLLRTLDNMLLESGVEDEAVEIKGPTQIHNLIEIIKKEQNVYDLVFSEVIRQVSVECIERGQLLSKLRQKYADLLNRIPRQLKSLHAEVMAQRSLDRRLTEELLRFKSSISFLTSELQEVKEHDQQVTEDATSAEEELAKALKESQTNANLVDEYHDLYELQRNRLENSVKALTEERDLWSNAAYSLALKIISVNDLTTAKRLHVCEKAWFKLANHFSVMLTDQDSEELSQIQKQVEEWREIMFPFKQVVESADKKSQNLLKKVKAGLEKWIGLFDDTLITTVNDVRSVKLPPDEFISKLYGAMTSWEEKLGHDSERFGGGLLLTNQEQLSKMAKKTEEWTEISWRVYRRHLTDEGESYHVSETMIDVNAMLRSILKQLEIRISGENGFAKALITLQNKMDFWITKLSLSINGGEALTDTDWFLLYDRFGEYVNMIDEIYPHIGSQQREEDRIKGIPHTHIDMGGAMASVQDWFKKTLNGIEAEDGKLLAQVTSIHTKLIHWMVQMLLYIAPNHTSVQSHFPVESSLVASCSYEELYKKGSDITDHLSIFTNYLCQCCLSIVEAMIQLKRDQQDEDAEQEKGDYNRLRKEAIEWIHTCGLCLRIGNSKKVDFLTEVVLERLQDARKESGVPQTPSSRPATQDGAERMIVNEDAADESAPSTGEKQPVVDEDKIEGQEDAPTDIMPLRMEVIGEDENVQGTDLGAPIWKEGSQTSLSAPSSSLTQSAYDAIAKMNEVQDELLAAEMRAQAAEQKVFDLQDDLNDSNEQIRFLQKRVASFELAAGKTTADDKTGENANEAPPAADDNGQASGSKESGKRATSRGSPNKKTRSKKK